MRFFVTGGVGYLGRVVIRHAVLAGYTVGASYFSAPPDPDERIIWAPLDVRDSIAVEETLDQFAPDVVIHTAFRQSGADLMATTADGAGYVAHAAAAIGARLIHMSSDVIFDGEHVGAYTEDDPPAPISPYGEAKAQAEALVMAIHPDAAIVRTSLIYGFNPIDRQTRFAVEIASGERNDRLFQDEYRCPIYVEDLAAALVELAAIEYRGVLHIAGAEAVSRYELGELMARACGYDPAHIPAGLSAESPIPRPRNCVLAISRAGRLLQTRLRGVREVLRDLGRPVE
ncbi:MAG: sugar nucleotide-binding protein [Oscillochloris sp.]|nr:sugar nucleotide-binding protein [Oscillochloris sp.]